MGSSSRISGVRPVMFRELRTCRGPMIRATIQSRPGASRSDADELAEGFAKLGVEHCVDNGVDEAVHVTEPRCHNEGRDARLAILPEF